MNQALNLLKEQKMESTELRNQLEQALKESKQSIIEIQKLREELKIASNSIEEGRKLFKEFEKEEKAKRKRLLIERNLALILALSLAISK